MNFITKEEVKQAAAQGELEALKCSLKHHQQGRDASIFDLLFAIKEGRFHVDGELCAMCRYKDNGMCTKNGTCPLHVGGKAHYCCDGKWQVALRALDTFGNDYSNANFKAFRDAEAEICFFIQDKIDEVEAKEKKKQEPELRHGSFGTATIEGKEQKFWYTTDAEYEFSTEEDFYREHQATNIKIYGNTEDNIELLKEPYKDFEVDRCTFKQEGNIMVICSNSVCKDGHRAFTPDEVDQIITGLRRWRNK